MEVLVADVGLCLSRQSLVGIDVGIDAYHQSRARCQSSRGIVGQLHDEPVDAAVLDAAADYIAVNVAIDHACRLEGFRLAHETGASAGIATCLEEVFVINAHLAAHIAVKSFGDGVLDGEILLLQRSHERVVDVDCRAVDGDAGRFDCRRSGVADGDVDRQRATAREGLAGVGDIRLEAVGEVLFVLHDDRTAAVGVSEGVDDLDAGIVEESVEVGQEEVTSLAADGQGIGDGRSLRQVDARGVEHQSHLGHDGVAFAGIADDVAGLGPQNGKVVGVVVAAVADDLHAQRRALSQSQVASRASVAVSVHGQRLHIDVVGAVGPLVEHGDDGILAHAVHEEVQGLEFVVDIAYGATCQRLRGVGEVRTVACRIGHVHADEHGVVAHEEVVLRGLVVVVDVK